MSISDLIPFYGGPLGLAGASHHPREEEKTQIAVARSALKKNVDTLAIRQGPASLQWLSGRSMHVECSPGASK